MNKVLMTAVIVLPLVMFLAIFGKDIVGTFKGNATDASAKGDDLKTAVSGSGFGGG